MVGLGIFWVLWVLGLLRWVFAIDFSTVEKVIFAALSLIVFPWTFKVCKEIREAYRKDRETRKNAARTFKEHQGIKQIATKLLQFLEKHAEEMPWGRIAPDEHWFYFPEPVPIDWDSKYFGHYQTKTKRTELKLDRRPFNHYIEIRYQDIVDGQMRPMTRYKIYTREIKYVDEKGKLREDYELKQIFEAIFSTVISVYKKRVEARKKKEAEDRGKVLVARKNIEKELQAQTLKALNNNEVSA